MSKVIFGAKSFEITLIVTFCIGIAYRLMASLFVDQMRLFLNDAERSPGITASVSRILPPKIALIMIAYLRVSKPVPNEWRKTLKSKENSHSHHFYLQSHLKLWLNYRHHFHPF